MLTEKRAPPFCQIFRFGNDHKNIYILLELLRFRFYWYNLNTNAPEFNILSSI